MRGSEKRIAVLDMLHEHEQAAPRAWVLAESVPPSFPQSVESAVREGLAELADRDTRAELSVQLSRLVRWAVRLTPHGRDVLAYAHARPPADSPEPQPGPGERLVELSPAQMDAVRIFVSLGDNLASPPAEGLADRVRAASFSRTNNRWRLCLSDGQVASIAFGLYLHRLTRSEAEANRFARDYGITYRTSPGTGTLAPVVIGQRAGNSHGM